MLNIVELERRWLAYKIRSYLPYIILTLAITILIFILTFVMLKEENRSTPMESERIEEPIMIQKKEAVQLPLEPITSVISQNQHSVALVPSLDFMKKIQNAQQPQYRNENRPQVRQKTIVHTKKTQEVATRPAIKEEIIPIKMKTINIKRQNNQNDIYEIIARFKKNNNPALSLFVAKKYYEMQNYKQAYNYSLITNSINTNIESSWIIFSKSLVKLGKRSQAIKTLQKYISQSHSNSAKILLDEIKSGKFQ